MHVVARLHGGDQAADDLAVLDDVLALGQVGQGHLVADRNVVVRAHLEVGIVLEADPEQFLSKAGHDYLAVLSGPPQEASPDQPFAYTPLVRSKKGGVKVRLDAGPAGMKFGPDGKLTWVVPKDFAQTLNAKDLNDVVAFLLTRK